MTEWRRRMIQRHELTGETCMYVRADIADGLLEALRAVGKELRPPPDWWSPSTTPRSQMRKSKAWQEDGYLLRKQIHEAIAKAEGETHD